jgi:Putative peptidoglycan binding domain
MKQLFAIIFIGSLALAFTAQGVENSTDQTNAKKARKAQTAQHAAPTATRATTNSRQLRSQRSFSTAPSNRRFEAAPQRRSTVVRENNLRNNRTEAVRERSVRNANQVRNRSDLTVNRQRNIAVNRERNVAVNRQRNITVNRRNVRIVNNWRSERFSGPRYAAFRNYHREWHDRDWWTSRHSRIVFVFGGPYYWNAGYWYPAWGYYPGYTYPYDGPIYGYNNLPPDQVVMNVQAQLQRDGYYDGPIDGVLGPMTREAIAAFQDDNGLAVTSAVDEPTLATLGLV